MNATEDLEPRISSTQAAQVSAFVERARGGDRDAFEKLIVLHQDEIFRVVFFRTRSRIDSEDLVQDIFMSAFKYLP